MCDRFEVTVPSVLLPAAKFISQEGPVVAELARARKMSRRGRERESVRKIDLPGKSASLVAEEQMTGEQQLGVVENARRCTLFFRKQVNIYGMLTK